MSFGRTGHLNGRNSDITYIISLLHIVPIIKLPASWTFHNRWSCIQWFHHLCQEEVALSHLYETFCGFSIWPLSGSHMLNVRHDFTCCNLGIWWWHMSDLISAVFWKKFILPKLVSNVLFSQYHLETPWKCYSPHHSKVKKKWNTYHHRRDLDLDFPWSPKLAAIIWGFQDSAKGFTMYATTRV